MKETMKSKKENKLTKVISNFFRKLDKKLERKAKEGFCCCGGSSQKNKSCSTK